MKLQRVVPTAILVLVSCLSPAMLAGADEGDRAPLILEVRLGAPLKLSHLKPGDAFEVKAARDVYSGERRLIPAGSPIHLTVSKMERRLREKNDHWPWVVRLFTPRHENFPAFQPSVVSLPDGEELRLPVSLVSAGHTVALTPQAGAAAGVRATGPPPRANPSGRSLTLVLEAERPAGAGLAAQDSERRASGPAGHETPAAGTQAQVVLLGGLSASKNHSGDTFQARLLEPVRAGSGVVLPEGVVLEGRVTKSVRPRRLSRPGSLSLAFTRLTFPTGAAAAIAASPSGAEADAGSRMRMDSEGRLIGGSPGKARFLIDLGAAGGIAKATDDTFQLIAEALVSTATDASTAGSARIIAAAFSGIYFFTRHGRDVILPKYTKMDITFGPPRPLPLQPAQ